MRLVALVLLATACAGQSTATPSPTPSPTPVATNRPIPAVTPGGVTAATKTDVCTPGWAQRHRRTLTKAQKAKLLAAYRLPAGVKVVEWDHLVPLELGGGNGVKQVWPMLDRAEVLRKDRLEDRLHAEVCAGSLRLGVAQERSREYWLYW